MHVTSISLSTSNHIFQHRSCCLILDARFEPGKSSHIEQYGAKSVQRVHFEIIAHRICRWSDDKSPICMQRHSRSFI